MSEQMLDLIKSRRVIRNLTDQSVDLNQLEKILEAGRWSPVGGNQRVHRFVAIRNPKILKLLRMVSPGMAQRPQAIILLCIDWDKVSSHQFATPDRTPYIDLGTAMQTMMLAAHAIGLGSGPVTSFSKEAVRVILNLPQNLGPEILICIGHAAPSQKMAMRSAKKITWQSLTDWERFADS